MEYQEFALDLGERTLELLRQYDNLVPDSDKPRYEVTLLINCLLGLIILPKEKGITYLPSKRISQLSDWGIKKSVFNIGEKRTVRELIEQIRGGVAHMSFDFEVDELRQIEYIIILDDSHQNWLAKFHVSELRFFLESLYAEWSANFKTYSQVKRESTS